MEIADFLGQEGKHALEAQGKEPEHGIIISLQRLLAETPVKRTNR